MRRSEWGVSLTVVLGPVFKPRVALADVGGVGRPPDLVDTVGVTAAVMSEQQHVKLGPSSS